MSLSIESKHWEAKKVYPCSLHKYGFSPVWLRLCAVTGKEVVNVFPCILLKRLLSSVHFKMFIRHEESAKAFSHLSHLKGFPPVCVVICRVRPEHSVKAFPHVSHLQSFSPVSFHMFSKLWASSEDLPTCHTYKSSLQCVFICWVRYEDRVKDFPHVSHLKSFSPMSIFICLVRTETCMKTFPHLSHLAVFCPVWDPNCLKRLWEDTKPFPHVSHLKGFSPVCIFKCIVRREGQVKVFPHSWHL